MKLLYSIVFLFSVCFSGDYSVIQAKLDLAKLVIDSTASQYGELSGTTVELDAEFYDIGDSTLILPPRVTLRGASQTATLIRGTGTVIKIARTGAFSGINNIQLKSTGNNKPVVLCVDTVTMNNFTIENTTIVGKNDGFSVEWLCNGTRTSIRNSAFHSTFKVEPKTWLNTFRMENILTNLNGLQMTRPHIHFSSKNTTPSNIMINNITLEIPSVDSGGIHFDGLHKFMFVDITNIAAYDNSTSSHGRVLWLDGVNQSTIKNVYADNGTVEIIGSNRVRMDKFMIYGGRVFVDSTSKYTVYSRIFSGSSVLIMSSNPTSLF